MQLKWIFIGEFLQLVQSQVRALFPFLTILNAVRVLPCAGPRMGIRVRCRAQAQEWGSVLQTVFLRGV